MHWTQLGAVVLVSARYTGFAEARCPGREPAVGGQSGCRAVCPWQADLGPSHGITARTLRSSKSRQAVMHKAISKSLFYFYFFVIFLLFNNSLFF